MRSTRAAAGRTRADNSSNALEFTHSPLRRLTLFKMLLPFGAILVSLLLLLFPPSVLTQTEILFEPDPDLNKLINLDIKSKLSSSSIRYAVASSVDLLNFRDSPNVLFLSNSSDTVIYAKLTNLKASNDESALFQRFNQSIYLPTIEVTSETGGNVLKTLFRNFSIDFSNELYVGVLRGSVLERHGIER